MRDHIKLTNITGFNHCLKTDEVTLEVRSSPKLANDENRWELDLMATQFEKTPLLYDTKNVSLDSIENFLEELHTTSYAMLKLLRDYKEKIQNQE